MQLARDELAVGGLASTPFVVAAVTSQAGRVAPLMVQAGKTKA